MGAVWKRSSASVAIREAGLQFGGEAAASGMRRCVDESLEDVCYARMLLNGSQGEPLSGSRITWT